LQGMLYIGNRPTLNGKRQSIEVNIFDFDSNIYRQKVVLQLMARIRPDKPFANLKELESQLVIDKSAVLTRLNNSK
jgi:FAD synthase